MNTMNGRSSREIQVSNYEAETVVLLRVLKCVMLVDWSRIRLSASLKLYFWFITKQWVLSVSPSIADFRAFN